MIADIFSNKQLTRLQRWYMWPKKANRSIKDKVIYIVCCVWHFDITGAPNMSQLWPTRDFLPCCKTFNPDESFTFSLRLRSDRNSSNIWINVIRVPYCIFYFGGQMGCQIWYIYWSNISKTTPRAEIWYEKSTLL